MLFRASLGRKNYACGVRTSYVTIISAKADCTYMARPKKLDGGSRHGKHAPDVFWWNLHLFAGGMAIAILTAGCQGKMLSNGLRI